MFRDHIFNLKVHLRCKAYYLLLVTGTLHTLSSWLNTPALGFNLIPSPWKIGEQKNVGWEGQAITHIPLILSQFIECSYHRRLNSVFGEFQLLVLDKRGQFYIPNPKEVSILFRTRWKRSMLYHYSQRILCILLTTFPYSNLVETNTAVGIIP